MESIMTKLLKSSIWSSIALIILGLLLIFYSELTILSISYAVGGILIAIGVLALIKYISNINKDTRNEIDIVYGIGTIILGIIVISNPKAIASIIPFVLGVLIVINSTAKIDYSFKLKRNKNNLWISTLVVALIAFVCGILLIFNPFAGAEFITKIIGAILLIYAVLDIISTIRISKVLKETFGKDTKKKIKDSIPEAEIVEDNTKNKDDSKEEKDNE